ncbi:MAG: radical SAM family heme chaperone HemW [Thermoanaerobaculia bacterium]|nr:radical SAM family heme chaperone HemW [Thermoanaerobaculia bacterium]
MSPAQAETTGEEAAGLYLHVPFCSRICPYCDFAVLTAKAPRRREFVDWLLAEIALERDFPVAFDTVYLGGGTPSILELEDLERLLLGARERFELHADTRFFLEANPEDVSGENLAGWRALGFETLSLGVQSFDDAELAFLGRRHDGTGARASVEQALAAGFSTVSLDLIFGLPGQTRETFRGNLEAAITLGVQHVSCYQLTIHEDTAFGRAKERGKLRELPEPEQAELFLLAQDVLGTAGFECYEVSNYARTPEHQSRHNRKYWRHVPYLGLGPSAHSFDGRSRWWNERALKDWRAKLELGMDPVEGAERLTDEQLALEAVMFGMRTAAGIDLEAFRRRFGIDLEAQNRERITKLGTEGLVICEAGRLRPTVKGLAVADGLAAGFELRTDRPFTAPSRES